MGLRRVRWCRPSKWDVLTALAIVLGVVLVYVLPLVIKESP